MKRLPYLSRSKAKILTSILALAFIIVLSSVNSFSTTYYIAPPAGGPGGSGTISDPWHDLNYALNKYANDGVQARVRPGDTLYLRGGVYDIRQMTTNGSTYMAPVITLGSTNANSPTTTIMSYPGEWAILDGYNTCRALYGYPGAKQYNIVFQNFEVRNGLTVGMIFGSGWDNVFLVNSVFRNIYFHDNTDANYDNNPAGLHLSGDSCIVEYCTFENNGTPGSSHLNSSNLALLNSYNSNLSSIDPYPRKNNIIRYNRFIGSAIGIKDKGDSNFIDNATRTNAHPEWANQIYNNIFKDQLNAGYYIQQDYVVVHHNVFYNTSKGIFYENYGYSEKTVWQPNIYNNTFINNADSSIAVQGGPDIYGYNWTIQNNLFIGSSAHYLVFFSGQSNIWPMKSDYNGFSTTQSVVGRYLNYGNVNFTTWKSYGYDTHSINAALSLINLTSNDFRLPVGSLAIGTGLNGADLGAFAYGDNDWYPQTGASFNSTRSELAPPLNLRVTALQ